MVRRIAISLFPLYALITALSFAQPPDTLWSQSYGNGTYEWMETVRPVPGGGFIMTGDTDEGPGAYASWIMRTDENGDEIWSLLEGGGDSDGTSYIEPTSDGGFIHCGSTRSYSGNMRWNGYVRKLDANGDIEWQRQLGTDQSEDYISCVREIPGDGYIAFGQVAYVLCLIRLAPNGMVRWYSNLPNESVFEKPYFLEPTPDGYLLAAYYPDQFAIIKTDTQGTVEWHYYYEGFLGSGRARCVRHIPGVGIFACGYVRFGDGSLWDAWYMVRLDWDGNVVWSDSIDYIVTEQAHEIWPTADGNLLVSGFTQHAGSSVDRWLVKYDYDGNRLWHYALPGGRAESCAQALDGGYVFSGTNGVHILDANDFRLFKMEPEVDIGLHAWTPVIPATGGWLRYGAQVTNMLVDPTPLDAWIVLTGPDGTRIPLNNFPVTLQPGSTFTEPRINVQIPAAAPNGTYTYEVHLGNATQVLPPGHGGSRNMAVESFTFVKGTAAAAVDDPSRPGYTDMIPGSEGPGHAGGDSSRLASKSGQTPVWPQLSDSWHPFTGQPFGDQDPDSSESQLDEQGARRTRAGQTFSEPTISVSPNPFNAATTITLTLPKLAHTQVTVYNALGREVAVLADGPLPVGSHTFTLDASNMASGLYFVRATVRETRLGVTSRATHLVQKVMLVR